jgi:hypothetical protein
MQELTLEQILGSLDEKYANLTDFGRHIYQGKVLPPDVAMPPRIGQQGALDAMSRMSLLMRLMNAVSTLGTEAADRARLYINKWMLVTDEEESGILKGTLELLPDAVLD